MSIKKVLSRFNHSMIGYLPVKIIEGMVGIITLKVYTSLFVPDIYGQYNLINSTINIVFLICLGWILQAVIRFTHESLTKEKEKSTFFTTILLSWITLVIIIGSLFLAIMFMYPTLLEEISRQQAFVIVFVLLSYSLSQILLTLLLYAYKRRLNAVLVLAAAVFKLLVTVILCKFYDHTAIVILISHGVTDFIIGCIALIASDGIKHIHPKNFSKTILIKFVKFGYPLIGLALTMSILTVSDRYIIKYYLSNHEVGLYVSNYVVSSAIFAMIMAGLSRGIYPKILQAWNNNDKEETQKRLSMGGKYYLMIALPAAIGLYILSEPIARLFLDAAYYGGNKIIGLVAFGMFFLGFSEYYNKGWELSKNTITILTNCVIASIVNIVLNILFIAQYGYIAAAYTTMFSFIVYFLVSKLRSNKSLIFELPKKSLVNILLSSGIMAIIVIVCNYIFEINVIGLFIVAGVSAAVYFGILYLTGEIKMKL